MNCLERLFFNYGILNKDALNHLSTGTTNHITNLTKLNLKILFCNSQLPRRDRILFLLAVRNLRDVHQMYPGYISEVIMEKISEKQLEFRLDEKVGGSHASS